MLIDVEQKIPEAHAPIGQERGGARTVVRERVDDALTAEPTSRDEHMTHLRRA